MAPFATVLYEDQMTSGSGRTFAPHDFLLALVADRLGGANVFQLRRWVDHNPRKGVDKLLADLKNTALLAGAGHLCVLVDADRVAEHLRLPHGAGAEAIVAAMKKLSDAPEKLRVHFLAPNLEGLMQAIEACAPQEKAPQVKAHNDRDAYLNRAAFHLPLGVRDCVKTHQASLAQLAEHLSDLCTPHLPAILAGN